MDRSPFDLPTELLARWPVLLAAVALALACLGLTTSPRDAGTQVTLAGAPTEVPPAPAVAAAAAPPAVAAADLGGPVEEALERAAADHGLDPALVKGVAWVESSWRPHVVSHAGAIGVMQLLPETVEVAARLVGRPLDPYAIADNIDGGAAYLAYLLRIADDVDLAVAAYHQGWVSVRERGPSPTSAAYVADVHRAAEVFRQRG